MFKSLVWFWMLGSFIRSLNKVKTIPIQNSEDFLNWITSSSSSANTGVEGMQETGHGSVFHGSDPWRLHHQPRLQLGGPSGPECVSATRQPWGQPGARTQQRGKDGKTGVCMLSVVPSMDGARCVKVRWDSYIRYTSTSTWNRRWCAILYACIYLHIYCTNTQVGKTF